MKIKQIASMAVLTGTMYLFTAVPVQAQPGSAVDDRQSAPMNPQMMQHMMQRRQQMMQGGDDDGYGMGGPNMHSRHHMMMQKMMERRMQGGGKGQRGGMGMMKPQMMQQRMQHMQAMEERMGRIETLLQELVDLQKKQ